MKYSYEEYIKIVKKVSEPRKQKITNSYMVYDYWRYYSHNKPKGKKYMMNSSTFYKIIGAVSTELAELFATTGELNLPNGMGKLEIQGFTKHPKLDENGKLTNLPVVNWMDTLKLWHEDKEARDAKLVLRVSNRNFIKCYYNKRSANYKNKTNMKFSLLRPLANKIRQNYNNGLFSVRLK